MSRDFQSCPEMYQGILRYLLKVFRVLQRCVAVSKDVWRCYKMCRCIQRCIEVFRDGQRCPEMRRGVQGCVEVFRTV